MNDNLEAIIRIAKAEALREAADVYVEKYPMRYLDPAVGFLKSRADAIERNKH